MLTGKLVRVRYARDRIVPCYLNVDDPEWRESAGRLLDLFRGQEGLSRGELEEEIRETFGDDHRQIVHQGLAKLLEDRCEFEVVAGVPPEELREAVFRAAAEARRSSNTPGLGGMLSRPPHDIELSPMPTTGRESMAPDPGSAPASGAMLSRPSQNLDDNAADLQGRESMPPRFDRDAILRQVADAVGLMPSAVDHGLFADLKSEQRLVTFKDISTEHLLQRYNVALAQAVLLRSTRVHVHIRNEPPQRARQLFRWIKFHRLVCETEKTAPKCYALHLDGPLSLFSATQKYGLQLALFLPTVLLCRDYEVQAELLWGPQRKPKRFALSPRDGLVSHASEAGTYVPPELGMFAELFRKRVADWEISEETEVLPLGDGFWVPDFCLTHRASGATVFLEVLGFWRRSSAEKHLERLRQHADRPFLLAVSDQLHVDEAELEEMPAGVHRFRNMPLPDEVARLADELLQRE